MKRIAIAALVILALVGGIVVVYHPILSAGFVGLDDDIHVYENPFLNPPSLASLASLWQRPYEQLYVPLAYTLFAAVAYFAEVPLHLDPSVGHSISLDPRIFHGVAVAFHLANVLLCYLLLWRLTRRRGMALLGTLVFALHPLQVESVGWISELRGLSSSFFALGALLAFVLSRQVQDATPRRSHLLLGASTLLVIAAMLCKPAAAALPLVALAMDRTVLATPWRRALATASVWAACALPFVWITHAIQAVPPAGESLWWQRPFVAGDALAFYLRKTVLPIDLCVDHGRTPRLAMSSAWGYLAWAVPVGLFGIAYRIRKRRPFLWLGVLMFVAFLAPTLGLVPFAFQAYSTVADRFAYLALFGVGLALADAFDCLRSRKIAFGIFTVALVALAALSLGQSRHWSSSEAFLRHTIDVNPGAAFAYNSLGDLELARGNHSAAVAHYQACASRDPSSAKAYINLAEVYLGMGRAEEAESAMARAARTPGMTADDFSNLGIVLMKMSKPEQALEALATAVAMDPGSATHLYNQANALAALGQFDRAEDTFRRCIAIAPTLAGAHMGLGIVLAETHRLVEALAEFRTTVRLQPSDPAALDNLKRAESLSAEQSR